MKILNKKQKEKAERISKLFKELKDDGVEAVIIKSDGNSYLNFYKNKYVDERGSLYDYVEDVNQLGYEINTRIEIVVP